MKILKKIFLTIILFSFTTASFAETKMRITLQLPLKAHLGQNLLVFKKELEKRSDIKVEIYDSAQLYKDKEVPQAVGSGAIEAGVASITRFAGTNPEVDVFYLPFLFDSEKKVRKATAQGSKIRSILDPAISKTGAMPLYYQAYGMAVMLSNGKPMKTPSDFKDKKIRVFGKTLGAFVSSLGGKPTLISGSEQYLAYQRGTVDAGMTGVSGVKSRKLYQVMDTLTVTNHGDIEFVVVVNQKWYNKLNAKQKSAIQTASKIAEKAVRDDMSNIEAGAYKVAKENGMKVVNLTSSELSALKKASSSVIDDYIKRTGGKGGVGDKLVQAAKKL
ncbi:MAG: C4-dicarboxylate ABC transporter substrate-binding protein [alpha proteobacterium HIMB114]|nr:MAG: C4-dicarboxylate ABC transporter substrate-binding protein [alpha proteobacterium HIMB114]